MTGTFHMTQVKNHKVSGWILAFVLFGFLLWAAIVAYLGWTSVGDVELPSMGLGALIFGVAASLVVGIGLMALIFYSSRSGYDEPPTYEVTPEDEPLDKQS